MSERILIGNRAGFAIEIEVTSLAAGVWADVLVWIGGESLGKEDDAFALYPLLGTVDGLLNRASDDASTARTLRLPTRAAGSRFDALWEEYRVHTCYLFDRYEVCCVSDYRTARFIWRARYLPVPELHDVRVPRRELARVAKELHAVYQRLSEGR